MSASTRSPTPTRYASWRRRHRVGLIALVPALAALAWTSSDEARSGWWPVENHVPVHPDGRGWVEIEDTGLRLDVFERLLVVPQDFGDPVHPPPGYALWRAVVEVRSGHPELRYCDLSVVDDRGRSFTVPALGLDAGSPVQAVACGALPEPNEFDEPPPPGTPEPRPGVHVSEIHVLLPDSAEPTEVRVSTGNRDASGFGAAYAAFPVD